MTSMTSFAIGEIRALVRRADRSAAQTVLEKIADAVLPIMTKRRFRVRTLREFFPKNPHLLGMNVNRGATIYIRLRPQSLPDTFLPYEALLETMLHELTHMVHGPHNSAFYKLLDELKDEMESLMVRGLVGQEGARFYDAGVGHSIQTEVSHIPVRHTNDNHAAVLAAKRREHYQRLLGGVTSQRLGSAGSMTSTSRTLAPRELRLRALEAAERRRRDNTECGNVVIAGTTSTPETIELLGLDDTDDGENEMEQTPVGRPLHSSTPAVVINLVDEEDEIVPIFIESSNQVIDLTIDSND
ncbi:hypothetical protein Poli38472_005066 [Pythium oligandrum]|uniref:WLM domain-containing protein n=1 Tax=Pythium oligandrum TaxID=41045 RepID=A0A8K1CG87_PYTOL|nr:hypothetical protein Poli38472_005066 [Pythium oligandrum]|eukprot:TMW62448.1 hypothetical protein Poli38472_005066 [Pythium oligandrum]